MATAHENTNLEHLGDIQVDLAVELAARKMKLSEVRGLRRGEVIELDKLAGEAFALRVNGVLFGEGETVVVNDAMAYRVTRMVEPPGGGEAQSASGLPEAEQEIELVMAEDDPRRHMRFVAEGPFVMGGSEDEVPANERPAHTVHLPAFFIDSFPVTNADYLEFVHETGYRQPHHWLDGRIPMGMDRHPVTNVSWQDAMAYAEWAGKRLPTEAEWEKAARGTDRRPYPWGDRFIEGERCNANNMVGTTTPVDEFPDGRSPYGVWDMAGNVYEWCSDYYDEEYYQHSPPSNPGGPPSGQERTVRGGTFSDTRGALRTTHRFGQGEAQISDNVGFRCVMDM